MLVKMKAVSLKLKGSILKWNTAQKVVLLVGLTLFIFRIGYYPESGKTRRLKKTDVYTVRTVRYDSTWMLSVHCLGIISVTGIGIYLFKSEEDGPEGSDEDR